MALARMATSAIHGCPLAEREPEERKAARERVRLRRALEVKAIAKEKRRINKRQSVGDGWDGRAANNNIAWPLAKALLAEKNTDLLKIAMRYRQVEASANGGAELRGTSSLKGELEIDQRTVVRPDGSIAYKGVRMSMSAKAIGDTPARHYYATNDNSASSSRPIGKPWTGDAAVNEMIDAKPLMVQLHAALGPLVELFEALVIEGKTYEEVGRALGSGNKVQAMGAARAMVHLGLATVAPILRHIKLV